MTALQPSTDETSTAPANEPSNETTSGVREDLLSYAELGGFTLSAKTHAWYAAVDTITNPEEARAASTVLAELRGRDLPATRDAASRLVAETTLGELNTTAAVGDAVALLLRVRATLAILTPAAYESNDLEPLAAATADGRWRKERGVKLSWGQRRSLRKTARSLAAAPGTRRAALHTALASVAADRTLWAALSPTGARPALPADPAIVDGAVQAIEAARTGLRELDRLLPEYDLAAMPFQELADLVDELAADEGTLYRLPTLRALRDSIEQQGHADLLAELSEQHADNDAVAAACERIFPSRTDEPLQSLLPNPREEGRTRTETPREAVITASVAVAEPELAEPDQAVAEEPPAETEVAPEPADEPAAARTALTAEPEAAEAETAAEADAEATDDAVAEEPEATTVAEPEATDDAVAETEPAEVAEEAEAAEAVAEAEVTAEPALTETVAEAEVTAEPAEAEVTEPAEAETTAETAAAEAPAEAAPAVEAEAETDTTTGAIPAPRERRPRKPSVTPGRPVSAYSAEELLAVVRWIDSDTVDRTEDELLRAAMKELGFSRLGPRIKESLGAAVAEARG